MAYFLFIDESGQDRKDSPCEVLAGVAIEDQNLWNLIRAVQEAELRFFGRRYSDGPRELKARKILKRKTFKHANAIGPIPLEERAALAKDAMDYPEMPTQRGLAALAQAKLDFVTEVFNICARFRCRAFASVIRSSASRVDASEYLRKDYVYLFQRYHYFLEGLNPLAQGVVVFDELEKTKSHILVTQLDRYFKQSPQGQQQAGLIIPEPFFVHSDLTTGVQIADLLAYVLSWGFRAQGMNEPIREELLPYVQQACALRHLATREVDGNPEFRIWSFAVIDDLRPRSQQA